MLMAFDKKFKVLMYLVLLKISTSSFIFFKPFLNKFNFCFLINISYKNLGASLAPQKYTIIYKPIQTISTKCQYHIAQIKPTWYLVQKWPLISLVKHTIKNIVPIITCKPWKPVII